MILFTMYHGEEKTLLEKQHGFKVSSQAYVDMQFDTVHNSHVISMKGTLFHLKVSLFSSILLILKIVNVYSFMAES